MTKEMMMIVKIVNCRPAALPPVKMDPFHIIRVYAKGVIADEGSTGEKLFVRGGHGYVH